MTAAGVAAKTRSRLTATAVIREKSPMMARSSGDHWRDWAERVVAAVAKVTAVTTVEMVAAERNSALTRLDSRIGFTTAAVRPARTAPASRAGARTSRRVSQVRHRSGRAAITSIGRMARAVYPPSREIGGTAERLGAQGAAAAPGMSELDQEGADQTAEDVTAPSGREAGIAGGDGVWRPDGARYHRRHALEQHGAPGTPSQAPYAADQGSHSAPSACSGKSRRNSPGCGVRDNHPPTGELAESL